MGRGRGCSDVSYGFVLFHLVLPLLCCFVFGWCEILSFADMRVGEK